MNEPMRSAAILALMMGGLGMIAFGVRLSNQQKGFTMGEIGAIAIMSAGMASLMLGVLMCLVDIFIYGYR